MVTFSQLIASMRSLVIERITEDGRERDLLVLALGMLEARLIAEPFFAICRAEYDFASDGEDIAKRLRNHVKEEIEERNRIAHADWGVARWSRADGQAPIAERVLVKPDKQQPIQRQHYDVGDIDKLCERAELLRNVVWEFGSICLQRGNYHPRRGLPLPKVSEALQIQDGRVVYLSPAERQVPFPPT
jgi:hypothetical protein